jgi:SAM-dependent methyltransferase
VPARTASTPATGRSAGMDDHDQLDPQIAAHYAEVPEQPRLAGPGSLERIRTQELLGRWLPPPPAVVVDVGGAAGVYALPLAAQGYQVHLVDPVALHVAQALRASAAQPAAPLASATVGDARRLDRPDASADAVLLLGPLYHLTDRADRIGALTEARRVLRPGGVLAAAAISRFASTYDGLLRGYLDEPGFEAIVERDVAEGQHRNRTGRPEWFTTAFFHLPAELAGEVAAAGLRLAAVLAVEGPGGVLLDVGERLADPDRRERVLAAIRRVEAEPSLLGASMHLLAVAHR